MGKSWTSEEINYIRDLYMSGLRVEDVYFNFKEIYGSKRTIGAIALLIKRKKFQHTDEQKKSIRSNAKKGQNNPMFGKHSWCNGLTNETSEKVLSRSKKTSATRKEMYAAGLLEGWSGMRDKDPWCKGLTKFTDDRILELGKKISSYRKKEWELMSQEQRNDVIGRLTAGANKRKNDTVIEIKIRDLLISLDIDYIQQYRNSNFIFDFYLPMHNSVIECQGDYWHGNPVFFSKLNSTQLKNIERDKKKKNFLYEKKITSFFFWEYDIHNNIEAIKEKLIELVRNTNKTLQ